MIFNNLLENLRLICQIGYKEWRLSRRMTEEEKDLYMGTKNMYRWTATKFFEMKALADRLQKEGRINLSYSKDRFGSMEPCHNLDSNNKSTYKVVVEDKTYEVELCLDCLNEKHTDK